MKLTYSQRIAYIYTIKELDGYEYIVAQKFDKSSHLEDIEIYKTSHNDISFGDNKATKIYELLEKATTPELAIDFCQKYGTLINANSRIIDGRYFRTNKILKSNAETIDISTFTAFEKNCLTDSFSSSNYSINQLSQYNIPSERVIFSPEHMNLEHFYYYVYTLIMLDDLYIENTSSLSFDSALGLVKNIEKYCSYVEAMLGFEYSICDGLVSFLTAFPFYLYNIPSFKVARDTPDFTITPIELKIFLTKFSDIIEQAHLNPKHFDKKNKELFIVTVKEISAQIYADIINFHMKDIPFSLLTSAKYDPLCDSFYSLGDAIIFQKILNLTSSTRKIRCRNEKCPQMFRPKNSNVKYCCESCRRKHHSRESMRKKRATEKNMQNNTEPAI